MAEIAAELVGLKVDVIVTSTDAGIASVKQRTQTIPIVMVNSTDPVETGFVASLARPGGNVTGLSTLSPALSAKRQLQLQSIEVRRADDLDRAFSRRTTASRPTACGRG